MMNSNKHPFFWIVMILGVFLVFSYIFSASMIYRRGSLIKNFGWEYAGRDYEYFVSKVDSHGQAAGKLKVGDQIAAVDNDSRVQSGARVWATLWLRLRSISPESFYTIRVKRGSSEHEFRLNAPLQKDDRHFADVLSLFVVSLVWFGAGMMIGLARPEQRTAQLACLSCLSTAVTLIHNSLLFIFNISDSFFQGFENTAYFLISSIHPLHLAIAYHFWVRMLLGSSKGRVWTGLKYLVYSWGILLLVGFKWKDMTVLQSDALQVFSNHARFLEFLSNCHDMYFLASLLLIALMAARNYRLVKEPDQRRRIKWLTYGSVAGVLPLAMVQVGELALSRVLTAGTFILLYQAAKIVTALIPVSLGYVILKHRVFDIHVVVRRGLQYLLAKTVLRVVLWLPAAGLAYTIFSNPGQTVGEALRNHVVYFYVFAVALISLKFRKRMSGWIDRKFFRQAYDRETILLELIDQIKKMNSMTEISRLISNELDSALHPKAFYVFYREAEKRDLTLNYSSGVRLKNLRIPEEYDLIRFMEQQGVAREFPLHYAGILPKAEIEWVRQLGINLIIPMLGTDQRLVGLLLLGEKKSEDPYTPDDRKLLEVLAGEIGIVYENVWLKERVFQEQKIKREVLERLEDRKINLVKECPACGACYDSSASFCKKDYRDLILSLPVERTLDEKYRLEQLIGKGGMGAVYEATDLRLGRRIAVKILMGSLFGDRMALQRFEREARASARLSHPNIITVHDYGGIRGEGAYLIMERVQGVTLRFELLRLGMIPPALAAEWFEQVFDGTKEAHRQGIIHRDLKPENILLSRDDKGQSLVKILDFGLAKIKLLDITDANSLTVPGTTIGTLLYMSPEQLSGEEVDERTDIYALGIMVAEALTGRRPFDSKTSSELVGAILHDTFHLEGGSKEVQCLDEVLQMCLAKDPENRFGSVEEMQHELIPAIRNCPPF